MHARAWILLVNALLLTPAYGIEAPGRIASTFNHTKWSARDGLPTDSVWLAQSSDGWLWLGGASGLARFDGVTFERVEIASPHKRRSDGIYGFFADEGGSLWMGHEYGGISRRLADGSFQHYGLTEGMPEATVTGISQDASGTMWALSSGLLRLEGQHWRKVTEDEGLPAGPAFSIYPDQHGIAASVLDHGRQGHFGLMGMRERANRIRGELTITSPPTAGTQVTLVVPARVAFVVAPWWRRLARTGAPTG